MNMAELEQVILITGGAGFIGSRLATTLHQAGRIVRIADIIPREETEVSCAEYMEANLCDKDMCMRAVRGVSTVIHLAANMGGMGTIHEANDFQIFAQNNAMTLNLIEASRHAGVQLFVLASSACVYPEHLQSDHSAKDIRLRENQVWERPPPVTQGLYGLEKLVGELVLHNAPGNMAIRVARFHNVYGPGGTWRGGREKAPAAFARKAVAAQMLGITAPEFEMWGSGDQRRSFLFIDDCIAAMQSLLACDYTEPLNIGSEAVVSMKELVRLAAVAADLDANSISFACDLNAPTGVAARSSDNSRSREVLRWEPRVPLEDGMKQVVEWIRGEILKDPLLQSPDALRSLLRSDIVHLSEAAITFAIVLPVTSRKLKRSMDCLDNLALFSSSLVRTTWRDTHSLGGQSFRLKVYLLIDHDDDVLRDGKAERVLFEHGINEVKTIICNLPERGHICELWRIGTNAAWRDGADYFILLGDDVQILDEGWMREMHRTFRNAVLPGFGCLAFADVTFPGMPTFPIVSRMHLDIFHGVVVPETFFNQDGDPYLFQLYRRFGASSMSSLRIKNGIGGSKSPRYDRKHATGWTFQPLDGATRTVEEWLATHGHEVRRVLTLDVIIPSYRVPLDTLDMVLSLKASNSCSVMFIVIVDDPKAAGPVAALQARHGHRPDVRIRLNDKNLGASATRNRGLHESAAEWVHFLDDDVNPSDDLLEQAEQVIREHPDAAGFVCTVLFPPAESVFTTAVHLSGVTYFWDIAQKLPQHTDLPWGVTASLIARRNKFHIEYDLGYPKTGGGEDIDFCIKKRDLFVRHGLGGFYAAPNVIATHPYWNNSRRSYTRFHNWSIGDGSLAFAFPQHSYTCYYPTSAELISALSLLLLAGLSCGSLSAARMATCLLASAIVSNLTHDLLRHLILARTRDPWSTVSSVGWVLAIMESTFIRIWSEAGRLRGQLQRRQLTIATYGMRFDWFVGRMGADPINSERNMSAQRFWLWLVTSVVVFSRF